MKIDEVILREGYELRLERDKRANMLVLHVKDTRTGRRSEVRGKLGYETDGYDPNDKLHQLLDKVGRSASVSDMMNGDVVHINPRHPQGPSAKDATDKAFNERISTIDLNNALEKISKKATNGERLVDVFVMRYKHDMTFKQIGDEIGTGRDRARQVYLRAERMVRKLLQDYDPKIKNENFADGKKKGKSRPGRVKKSGASCNGSVTSLRKKAKAGGEKGRMYHWCANMKSGRKKK